MSKAAGSKSGNSSKGKGSDLPFPKLDKLPETPTDLFHVLNSSAAVSIHQPHPDGNGSSQKQDYMLPWPGFESWRDARKRLAHFEKHCKSKITWAPFNDSESNDGPMTLNAYPGRAFVERVTNGGDACIETKAQDEGGPPPATPMEAMQKWFGLPPGALAKGDDEKAREIAKSSVVVRTFVGADPNDPKDCILDARDFGIGLSSAEMPSTILSLNRGLKKSKPYLTGKHGQGASSTYQYSDLTLIASRKRGAKTVAFTLVEASWTDAAGNISKTPTYRYLIVDGKIPEVEVPESEFEPGTLVRHIGYNADFTASQGERSMYGLLMRSVAEPLFPVWLEHYFMRSGSDEGYPTLRGYKRFGRLIRGTVNLLERAWHHTLHPPEKKAPQDLSKILHRSSEVYKLGLWDYGGRTGVGDLGQVKITYWVVEPKSTREKEEVDTPAAQRTSQDVLKNWVDPEKTVIFTLDGQTHAEESRAIVTGQNGAKLWAVGRYMVVQIDCNGLDPRAKYEMFTSTREHVKDTPIRKMIMEELARRLTLDTKLADLNVQFAAADVKKPEPKDASIPKLIKKYLKNAGVSFDQLTKKIEKWIEVEGEVEKPVGGKKELPPIEAQEPPTFIRWKFAGETIRMWPGQKYSFMFETDAAPHYWIHDNPAKSRIKVFAQGISYLGAGEMKGGRVRCHFQCPENAEIGTKGLIQAQLEWMPNAAKTASLPVDVIQKPEPKKGGPGNGPKGDDENEEGEDKKLIKIKVKKKDFTELEIPIVYPTAVTPEHPPSLWSNLGWPIDPASVAFSIRTVSGKVCLYYNAVFPPFLDLKRKMSKKSLEEAFVQRYEIKLVLHTIFTLNYDYVDEEQFSEDEKKKVRNLLCASAESLALACKSELEIEARLKTDDDASVDVSVTAEPPPAAA